MAITIQHKRDTASNWTSNNPTMSAGEIGVETDTGKFKFGDGSTAWSSLNYFETAAPSGPTQGAVQGSTAGFISGGQCFTISPTFQQVTLNTIQKIAFGSDGNATDQGDLLAARCSLQGTSSSTHGYQAGGDYPSKSNVIQKFAMSSAGNATDVGDLTGATSSPGTGGGAMSQDYGYFAHGFGPSAVQNSIEKYDFSSDGNATDVGDQSYARQQQFVHSSETDGFIAGGTGPGQPEATFQIIDKFPFSSDANAADTGGDLSPGEWRHGASWSTATHGYVAGGRAPPVSPPTKLCTNAIYKYPFSISSGYGTDVADLTQVINRNAGVASTTHGYSGGGDPEASPYSSNVIDKHNFSSGANSTDVGDLIHALYDSPGANNQI